MEPTPVAGPQTCSSPPCTRASMRSNSALCLVPCALSLVLCAWGPGPWAVTLEAQGRGLGAAPPATGRAAAPIDLAGYWVAEITEDWRWRMVTPGKGDYMSIPITPAAQKVGDAWDPAKDEAAGEQCKGYGAPGL